MDNITLKKKLSAYVSDKGYVRGVTEEVLYEILMAWEQWTGSSKDFFRSLDLTASQMGPLLGKAKKLKRDGHFGTSEFRQVKVDLPTSDPGVSLSGGPCAAVEIVWTNGQVIRFSGVDYLMDFLKKSA
jgi:hypothetical protein